MWVYEQALRCEMVASSHVCQPNHNYVHSDNNIHVAVSLQVHVLHACQCLFYPKGLSYSIIHRVVATQFSQKFIIYLYSICLISTSAVMPPSHEILIYRSYVLFLIHTRDLDYTAGACISSETVEQ